MVQIDAAKHQVTVNGREVYLFPKGYKALLALAEADGRVMSRDQIAAIVYGSNAKPNDSRAIDQHIARVRSILGRESGVIRTLATFGYSCVGVTVKGGTKPGRILDVERVFGKKPKATVIVEFNSTMPHLAKGGRAVLA